MSLQLLPSKSKTERVVKVKIHWVCGSIAWSSACWKVSLKILERDWRIWMMFVWGTIYHMFFLNLNYSLFLLKCRDSRPGDDLRKPLYQWCKTGHFFNSISSTHPAQGNDCFLHLVRDCWTHLLPSQAWQEVLLPLWLLLGLLLSLEVQEQLLLVQLQELLSWHPFLELLELALLVREWLQTSQVLRHRIVFQNVEHNQSKESDCKYDLTTLR